MRAWFLTLLLAAPASGHVAMAYQEGQVGPILNAGSATGNGRGSVANACGGGAAFGANGVGQVKDGDTVTLNINYAAGYVPMLCRHPPLAPRGTFSAPGFSRALWALCVLR